MPLTIEGKRVLGIFGNPGRRDALRAARVVFRYARRKRLRVGVEEHLARALRLPDAAVPGAALAPRCRWAVVLGGDGTLLRAAQLDLRCPVLAVNAGSLGFVTEVKAPAVLDSLAELLRGRAVIGRRMMLSVSVVRRDSVVNSFTALNDAVLHSLALARLVRLAVAVDGQPLAPVQADGVIVSSSTGSTAYSMSCGGPIVVPTLDAILVTPVCPHPIPIRPLVLAPGSVVTVSIPDRRQRIMLTVDGQIGFDLEAGDRVEVRRHSRRFLLAHSSSTSFLATVREKLRWEN